MTIAELKKIKEEMNGKKTIAKRKWFEAYEATKDKNHIEKKYYDGLGRFFASITSPMTAKDIERLSGGLLSKYSIVQYFIQNENGYSFNSGNNWLPNRKTFKTKTIKGVHRYALLDENGCPTSTVIEKEFKYNTYWVE